MTNPKTLRRPNPKKEDDLTQKTKTTKPSVRIKSLKARLQTMSFPLLCIDIMLLFKCC